MLFSALAPCYSCFSSETDESTQSIDTVQLSSTSSSWSLALSESYTSCQSVYGSSSSISSAPRAVILPYNPIRVTRRSALRTSINYMPHRTPFAPKVVHWSVTSLVDEDGVSKLSANIHENRQARRLEQSEKEWHRNKSPIPTRVQVKRPPCNRSKKIRTSFTLQSPINPSLYQQKRQSKEVLYPVLERPRRAASVVDIYRHKQALFSTKQLTMKALDSPARKEPARKQQPPPISPSRIIVEELKKSLVVLDSEPPNIQLTVCVEQRRRSSSEEGETLQDEQVFDLPNSLYKSHRRRQVDYYMQGEQLFITSLAEKARGDERKHRRRREKSTISHRECSRRHSYKSKQQSPNLFEHPL